MSKKNQLLKRYLKLFGKIFLGLTLMFFVLILIIRTPWAQQFIVSKITGYITNKTNTKVAIGGFYFNFSGDLQANNVYFEDKKGDTLFYARSLQADIPVYPILFNNQLHIDGVAADGVVANILREKDTDQFNFSFLIDALATPSDTNSNSSAKPMDISLGNFNLSDWKLSYTDAYLGTDLKLNIGKIVLDISDFDLKKYRIKVNELAFANSQINYVQLHPFPKNTDTTSTITPFLDIDDFEVSNLTVNYNSKPDRSVTTLQIGRINLSEILADVSKNKYETNDLIIRDSKIVLQNYDENINHSSTDSSTSFTWPELIMAAQNIQLENNSVSYSLNGAEQNNTTFNPNAFQIQQLRLKASSFEYQPKNFNIHVAEFFFREPSGIRLNQLSFDASLGETSAKLANFRGQLNQSSANAQLNITFDSIDQVLKHPQNSAISATISNLILEPRDFQEFVPGLVNNNYFDSLATQTISGFLRMKGNLEQIDEFTASLNWGKDSKINTIGSLSNPIQPDSLRFNLKNIAISSTKNDIIKFIPSKELGINVPQSLTISGKLSGTTSSISTAFKINIPEGLAAIDASMNFGITNSFKGTLKVDSLQLDSLLQHKKLGAISFNLEGSGSGTDPSDLNAILNGTISHFNLNGYNYRDISLSGKLKGQEGDIIANVNDSNLNMKANMAFALEAGETKIILTSKIIGADLQNLGLSRNNIKLAANVNGTYLGTPSDFSLKATVEQGIAVTGDEQYQIAPISLNTNIKDSITYVSIKSGFLNGELSSNASPIRITNALKKQLEHYFTSKPESFEVGDNIDAKLTFAIKPTPILSKVFFKGILDLDSISVDARFNSKMQRLFTEIKVPQITYAGSSVDSLNTIIKGDSVDLKFSAGIANLLYDPVHLKQTYLEGSLKNKQLALEFNSVNDTVQVMHVSSELTFIKDTLRLHIDPKNLVLNTKKWDLPEDNAIVMATSYLDLKNLSLSRNNQKIEVSTNISNMETDHIGILFDNFQLQTFLSLFNPDEALANGKVEGDFVILNPYASPKYASDITIRDFQVLQNPLGTLTFDIDPKSMYKNDFHLGLQDGGADLKLTGDYGTSNNTGDIKMELDIQKLEAGIIQSIFKETLSNPKGYLSGNILIGGTLNEPNYSGSINFNAMSLSLAAFNTTLGIDAQVLKLNQDEITFNSFKIKDASEDYLTLDGKIRTQDILNPKFDLKVITDKFRVLDSKKGDNELVYGIASIQANLKITGDLMLPVINGSLGIHDSTDLTYLVPQDQLDIQERDGIVIFVNRENPTAILSKKDRKNSNTYFTGMDINTILKVGNKAIFTIVLDERTNDKLQASGDATLNLNIDPDQDIRLAGRLELNSGFYRTSLYNLVSREFRLQEGSNIVWSGDPYDAKMDVTAIYEIETSAAPLMSAISFGQDTGVTGSYQQAAPFLVYLNIDGQLMEPEISFGLDMPENDQGSFGGAVYGRIQQLNEQESELNKQVFSLLTLSRFFPTTGSDGSNGGAILLAKDNVNKVLSSELTTFSNKLLGNSGFELGFDLDSFQENETGNAQNRTQLNINARKKLFGDRLIITAGSSVDVEGSATNSDVETPIIGNIILEYMLSEEGTYRLKGFRRQEYQNIIDGQLVITGIAFIFDREFNKFSQLFSPIKKSGVQKKKSKKNNN